MRTQPPQAAPSFEALEHRVFFAAQTIDSVGDVGQFASLAINPVTQRPAITYYDATKGDLKLATKGAFRWSVATIASAGDVGKVNSLKFNNAGEPCVAYQDPLSGALVFARQSHRRWQTNTIDATGAKHVSLVLDLHGRGRVSYTHDDGAAGTGLRFAAFDGNVWKVQTVEEGTPEAPLSISASALALEAKGLPHIAIGHENEDSLGYAEFDGTAWRHRAIDTGVGDTLGSVPSIAIDAHDRAHIAYGGEPVRAGGTFYTVEPNGSPFSERVILPTSPFTAFNDAGSTSVAIGRDGKPRIAYFGGDAEPGLRLATGNRGLATSFTVQTLDRRGTDKLGQFPSMAIDDRGVIHVGYYDAARHDLIYFTNAKRA
jgi:hypothetical protein